jgi:hypothetical protein
VSDSDQSSKPPEDGLHGTRRQTGGARREASERVLLKSTSGSELTGWTLNLSRGGVRIVIEDPVSVGDEFAVYFGEDEEPRHRGRVVWVQQEADGQITGIQFLREDGTPVTGTFPPRHEPPGG